jgi:PEP-CTERM motif
MTFSSRRRSKPISITNSRWAAYATAGAATAVGAVATAQADIHYSGPINQHFAAASSSYQLAYFALGNAANSFGLIQSNLGSGIGVVKFGIFGAASGAFAGFSANSFPYVSRLAFGANLNAGNFAATANVGTMAFGPGYGNSQWLAAGTGFIGFRFNAGSGMQFGWARVTMDGAPGNTFTLVDYAWGDVGQAITAGQTTVVPEPGSLGLLALGGVGLVAWRKRRSKAVAA